MQFRESEHKKQLWKSKDDGCNNVCRRCCPVNSVQRDASVSLFRPGGAKYEDGFKQMGHRVGCLASWDPLLVLMVPSSDKHWKEISLPLLLYCYHVFLQRYSISHFKYLH